MNNAARLVVPALMLLSLGCGLIQFDVHAEGDAQIQGCQGLQCVLASLGFGSFGALDLSQSQEWRDNNANKDKIRSATLTSIALDVTVPDGGDLSFLKNLKFYVSAPDAGKVLVAEGSTFPAGQSHVDLGTHSEVELMQYVKASSMTITTDVQGTQPKQNTTIHAKVGFHLKL